MAVIEAKDKNKIVLVLDTTIRGAFAAVAEFQESDRHVNILSYCQRSVNRAAAAGVSDLVSEVMRGSQLAWQDFDRFVVGHGPGSFTGIKIGLAFAYGVRLAHPEVPLRGYSALAALAEIRPGNLWFLPATRSQGYVAFAHPGERAQQWIVDLGSDLTAPKLQLFTSDSRAAFDWQQLPKPSIETVLPWPLLDQALGAHGIAATSHWQLNSLCGDIAVSMVQSTMFQLDANDGLLPEPQYLRKSAPEEAYDTRKGAAN
ncbi:MAG: tRNA (adenosine(37)-N6)-threonylcarbamoyltransferase complex dimerization subunit type 1 TsaB [Oligoflexus sp.]